MPHQVRKNCFITVMIGAAARVVNADVATHRWRVFDLAAPAFSADDGRQNGLKVETFWRRRLAGHRKPESAHELTRREAGIWKETLFP